MNSISTTLKRTICMVAIQLLALIAVPSIVMGSTSCSSSSSSSSDCTAPHGITLRCYSDNEGPLFPTGSGTFPIVDDTGCKIGYTEAISGNTFKQKWVVKDGKMEFELAPDSVLFSSTPIADALVAFPELAPYAISNPDAEVWVFSGDHFKNASNTLYWKGSGRFKKCDRIEVRCVFLVFHQNSTPYIKKCVGCHWFFNNTK